MPKFLEKKLKAKYGKKSDIPYKIMNKLGFMRGSRETAEGRRAEKKHKMHSHGKIRGLGGESRKATAAKSKSFSENLRAS
jgi:hypothetical protein